jgi:hypothetical protein
VSTRATATVQTNLNEAAQLALTGSEVCQVRVSGLQACTVYLCQVCAVNAAGASEPFNVTATTLEGLPSTMQPPQVRHVDDGASLPTTCWACLELCKASASCTLA